MTDSAMPGTKVSPQGHSGKHADLECRMLNYSLAECLDALDLESNCSGKFGSLMTDSLILDL